MAAIATATTFSVGTTATSDSTMMMMLSSPTATPAAISPSPSTKPDNGKNVHPNRAVGVWSSEEHDRFLEALKKYPQGPWKAITEYIGTRSVRQVQTHAQKYQEKVSRRLHGMQTGKAIRLRREHRIDHDVLALPTLISLPPELRNKHARRSHHHQEPITNHDGASPSSVSSSFLFDDSAFALMDVDDLPTLSESLDFFIENLS
ncbi:Myb domain [Phytophthora cactorum]|nr:Myb domain [Phytophthora cactorum]